MATMYVQLGYHEFLTLQTGREKEGSPPTAKLKCGKDVTWNVVVLT